MILWVEEGKVKSDSGVGKITRGLLNGSGPPLVLPHSIHPTASRQRRKLYGKFNFILSIVLSRSLLPEQLIFPPPPLAISQQLWSGRDVCEGEIRGKNIPVSLRRACMPEHTAAAAGGSGIGHFVF